MTFQGRALAALAAVVAAAGLRARADDAILYYVNDGTVTFTNVPSRKDVKPVPGLAEIRVALPSSLPATGYDPFIRKVADEEGLDASLIKAVALVESGFNPRAVSPKGARGIMQLMPATARQYGVKDPHDPYQSLRAGAQHLRSLLIEFDGSVPLALAAYNAGSGAVKKYGGIPKYRETQDYVRKVRDRMDGNGKPPAAPKHRHEPPPDVVIELGPDGTPKLTN